MAFNGLGARARVTRAAALSSTVAYLALALPAWADESPSHALKEVDAPATEASSPTARDLGEIIVTARKRQESIMRTPVIMEAISAEKLQDLKITDFRELAQVTPGLQMAPAFGTVGTSVYLRGLGNGSSANFADQAVQLNVDGVSTTHGAFYRAGMFDVAQVEILKGPQALFFGRSSSAGIVAVTSAGPTDHWESRITGGYEFDADEMSLDGYVAGPLTDTLGIRLAGFYSASQGWLRNDDPVAHRRIPDETQRGGRITLAYDNHAGVKVTAKYAKARVSSDMWIGDFGQRNCFGATPVNTGFAYDNCKVDRITQSAPYGLPYNPNVDWYSVGTFLNPAPFSTGENDPLFRGGKGYTYTDTDQATLNIDVEVAPGLTATSVTGWDKLDTVDVGQSYLPPTLAAPTYSPQFGLAGEYRQEDFSQELRLTSTWKGWINFLAGGFYSDGTGKNHTAANFPSFAVAQASDFGVKTRIYSAFGQLLITPMDTLELAAGIRYSNVRKRISQLSYLNNTAAFFAGTPLQYEYGDVLSYIPQGFVLDENGNPLNPSKTEHNTSPEFTVTWHPTSDVTIFGSYKQGYKAHGVNVNAFTGHYTPGEVGFFNGEKVKGWEGGIKASLFDRRLKLTASAYTYAYDNLQVAFSLGSRYTITVANGADARIKGIELEAEFQPVEKLTLNASLNYNDAKFTDFTNAPCYSGQQFDPNPVLASRCRNISTDPNIFFGAQDLSGQQLAHAPKWTGQFGVNYRDNLTDNLQFGINLNGNYSSSYFAIDQQNPLSLQKSYVTFDAALRLGKLDGPWEIGLIVRNVTNKTIYGGGIDDVGLTTPADADIYRYRPRQIQLQVTFRPDHF